MRGESVQPIAKEGLVIQIRRHHGAGTGIPGFAAQNDRPHPTAPLRRVAVALTLGATASALALAVAVPATAAPAKSSAARSSAAPAGHRPLGRINTWNLSGRTLTVRGWAIDPDAQWRSVRLHYTVNGHLRLVGATVRHWPSINRHFHAGGYHGSNRRLTLATGRNRVCVVAMDIGPGGANTLLGCRTVTVVPLGTSILKLAHSYVGRVRYSTGGNSPHRGFDCSGLTSYTYARFGVKIPRVAQAQYHAAKRVARAQARPGDLVFFHSGGGIYHVGIYAGQNKMVAAATPAHGIRYQTIYSSAVSFGTFLH